MTTSRYIHGTGDEERGRLGVMCRLLDPGSVREIALSGGERIVDFGCGPGQLSRALARASGRAVVAVERTEEFANEARRLARDAGEASLLHLRIGDVHSPPLRDGEWGTFDVAHARFLLEHVPDPLAVVRIMIRAVRPGGRIVLGDDDHSALRVHPEPVGFARLLAAYGRSFEILGNDPNVGRRLPDLLAAAGAQPVRVAQVFFGGCRGGDAFPDLVSNLGSVIAGAKEAMVGAGLVREEEFSAALGAVRGVAGTPGAAIWYAVNWAEGRRPPR